MKQQFATCVEGLRGQSGLALLNHGLEKEALRIDRYGYLSKKLHPDALGSPLTHPSITTDFSEAQLEFVTGVHNSIESCMQEMEEIHRWVYEILDDELLWPSSMPCMLRGEHSIPLATYGTSNLGKFKEVYRRGLALRFGKYMQTISGLHYNFSIPCSLWESFAQLCGEENSTQFRNESYLALIRNFQRCTWLLVYLFGTSPAVCGSFLAGREHNLELFDGESYYLPYATSLRMGPMGYQSAAQGHHYLSYNTLADYITSMIPLLTEPFPEHEALGIQSTTGDYQQLSLSLLQTEAESYGPIRPKPKAKSEQRPLLALGKQGIEYVEVRCLDLNPFYPTGIDRTTLYFLDAFMLSAWLTPSPHDSRESWKENQLNQTTAVERGRDPKVQIIKNGVPYSLIELGRSILEQVAKVALLLDEAGGSCKHEEAVALQLDKLQDVTQTPSALLLQQMTTWDKSYYRTIETLAKQHRDDLLSQLVSDSGRKHYRKLAIQSHEEQQKLELESAGSFEHFLANYMKLNP